MTKKTKLGTNIFELEYYSEPGELFGLGDDIELIIKDNKVVFNKGNSFSVKYHDGDWDTTLTHIPSDYGWQQFFQTLDDINVWRWKKNYTNNEVFDGGSWSLKITKNSKKLACHGDVDYPSNFDDFLEALKELIGMDIFQFLE